MKILLADFNDAQVISLIKDHLQSMQENSPPGSVYALAIDSLQTDDIDLYTLWEDSELLGMGALKQLDAENGEIKSMRTHKDHLRKGVANILLEHTVNIARDRAYHRLSLETGSGTAFDPALTLYKKYGFKNGEAFADYQSSEFNQFLHLDLD